MLRVAVLPKANLPPLIRDFSIHLYRLAPVLFHMLTKSADGAFFLAYREFQLLVGLPDTREVACPESFELKSS